MMMIIVGNYVHTTIVFSYLGLDSTLLLLPTNDDQMYGGENRKESWSSKCIGELIQGLPCRSYTCHPLVKRFLQCDPVEHPYDKDRNGTTQVEMDCRETKCNHQSRNEI